MLFSKPTKHGTGLILYGQQDELELLYEVIHGLAANLDDDKEDTKGKCLLLMNFAYEVRKAIQGDRIIQDFVIGGNDGFVTHYGCEFVWIDMLLFTNVLRYQARFFLLNRKYQAILAYLELAVEEALIEYDKKGASSISPLIGQGIDIDTNYIFLIYQHAHIEFVSTKPSKKRFRDIPDLINCYFSKQSMYHKKLIKLIEEDAIKYNCRGVDLEVDEFPKIVW